MSRVFRKMWWVVLATNLFCAGQTFAQSRTNMMALHILFAVMGLWYLSVIPDEDD